MNKNFSRLILIILSLAGFTWIFMNKFTDTQYVAKEAPWFVSNLNAFFSSMNLNYKLNAYDIASTVRFAEYLILAIILLMAIKLYVRITVKNIAAPLFIGLLTAVSEIYFKTVQKINIGIDEIVFSFLGFCIGLVFFFIFSKIIADGPQIHKYRSPKYGGRG